GGRMGREVCGAVAGDPELELVAAVDPRWAGADLAQVTGGVGAGIEIAGGIEDLARAGAAVAVDFTVAEVAVANMRWCAGHAVHAVVGTTGIASSTMAELSSG